MMISNFLICLFAIVPIMVQSSSPKSLKIEIAADLINIAEEKLMIGGLLPLSKKEKKVDALLKKVKNVEFEAGFINPSTYPPAMHFFNAKPLIEQSNVFKFIKQMPKGAVLHGHNTAMVSSEWILKNITYRAGLYICTANWNSAVRVFTFRNPFGDCSNDVRLVSELRAESGNVTKFDQSLEKLFNLYTETPYDDYPDVNAVWTIFQRIFGVLGDYIKLKTVFIDYHTQLLQELYDDNVMYVEIRTSLSSIYDAAGKTYTALETALVLKDVFDQFKKTHPGFLGAKIIYANGRLVDATSVAYRMGIFKQLYAAVPNLVIGFDLVGQEDLGNPLVDFVDELLELPKGAKFFFHAGETNWYGASTDLNLVEAILLNTARIGHGYALIKHPILWNAVRSRNIGIEVCPISNQVLNLVRDLRNHPGAFFMSENMPMIISNDDPGFWNAKALSYDFYYAFMSFAPVNAGLRTLKQLVLNSINHAILTKDEQVLAYQLFNSQWNTFLDKVIAGNVI